MLFRRTLMTAALVAGGLLASTGALAQFAERTIKFTNGVNEDHPVGVGVKKMQEVLAAKTGGKMKITAFWGGAAGGDLPATQALRAGTQEMVCTSSSPLVGIVKELGAFDLPFLFANEKEADAVLDGPAGEYFNKKLEAAGLVNLAYWENGFRNLTNSKKPVAKAEDFEGVKLRVMQNNIFLDSFKILGANAVPMAFGEVFTALETRTIDGQENPFVTIETSKFSEVQKYLSVTRHAYTPFLILYSKKLWDQLNPQEQAVLREAAKEGQKVQREANRALNEKSLASLRKTMTVNEVSAAEQKRMLEKVKPVYDKNVPNIGTEAVGVVTDALKKARGG
ncbi:tripartite ATP-independent transporter DctP family solute receptor [Variovorax boronicumulans]|uniref:Tripartite ATP-independent transporter DctP family solute receptor n=1 Tax=Variovorax boronicumulans TaxID=436515 RepID=A0AAW8E1C2_9BURK|nr:TRAP transporter substrate-binding protein [Variovorax boronicumulans]MDP9880409.1 tripartite ATP-independent transporter DctP family solute receptor [Variovorax boronicumulans]MDP9918650.1 tripartite ATP-independent transporter DctP family solute receptor [Variovorax boronicumulans]MDP9925695.1 tripartite ATP-independent transporter DctP family solute receptor [Variovorax boronicumulans]